MACPPAIIRVVATRFHDPVVPAYFREVNVKGFATAFSHPGAAFECSPFSNFDVILDVDDHKWPLVSFSCYQAVAAFQ